MVTPMSGELCVDQKFVVVNTLRVREKEFRGSVTYKQGNNIWTSELAGYIMHDVE